MKITNVLKPTISTLFSAGVAVACGSAPPASSTVAQSDSSVGDPTGGLALPDERRGSTTLYDARSNENYTGEKISKIMVMGIGRHPAVVEEFEIAFTEIMAKTGVEAVKASDVISTDDRQSEEAIVKKLTVAEYSGALVTRFVKVDSKFETKAPGESLKGQSFGQYCYDARETIAAEEKQRSETVTVTLETVLYKIPEAEIVWSGTTDSFNPTEERRRKVVKEIGKVIIDSLKDSGALAVQ